MATSILRFLSLIFGREHSTNLDEGYRPDIDGLRAIAVLAVIGFHAVPDFMRGGFVGVDVFFVISGYLISGIIFRAMDRGRFKFVDFYTRRVRRIFPSLVAMLLAVPVLAWPVLLWDEYQQLGKYILVGAGFVSNLALYDDYNLYFGATTTPLVHLWSLGVEEQFYILWPPFLVAIWRFKMARLAAIAAVATISFVLNVASIPSDPYGAGMGSFYLPSSRLWELSLGALLSYIKLQRADITYLKKIDVVIAPIPKEWLSPLSPDMRALLGAVMIAASFFVIDSSMNFPGWWALIPCVGTLLLISAGPGGWINRQILARRPMVFIGIVSYPLYLWHWPLLSLSHIYAGVSLAPIAICTAFALAVMTYKYIELPIRSSRNRVSTALTLCAVMAVCGGLGYLILIQRIAARPVSPEVDRFIRASRTDWLPGTSVSWTSEPDRLLELGSASRRTLFIGDSHIEQIYPRIRKIVLDHPQNERSAVFATRAACAPIVVDRLRDSLWKSRCKRLVQSALEYAKNPQVDRIVIGAHWPAYLALEGQYLAPYQDRPNIDSVLEKFGRLIAVLVAEGKRVYVVLNLPVSPNFDPRSMIQRTLAPSGFGVRIHSEVRAELEKTTDPIVSKVRSIAVDNGAIVVDQMDWLCDKKVCPAVAPSGEPMYHDSGHLNPSYVRENARFLDRALLDTDAALVR